MIVWLNGAFGAGKTTTAHLLAEALPARVFDAEQIGYLLRPIIGDVPHTDFKEWAPWRGLTVETARQVLDFVGGTLVVPQTVLQREYWTELADGFDKAGVPVRAFTLHAGRGAFDERVRADAVEAGALDWRLGHRDAYERALDEWLGAATTVVDTTALDPAAVCARIAADVRAA